MYDVAFVMKGSLRRKILTNLEKPKTAKNISKEFSKHIQSVSRALIQLEKKNFVKCLNPSDDRFRFYKITEKGKKVLKKLKDLEI